MHKAILNHLASHFPQTFQEQVPEIAITGIALDSRQVEPGNVFIALQGGSVDGHRFIPQAITQGAVAVVGSEPSFDIEVPYIRVTDGRLALAQLSAAFFGFPARELIVVGVTGTDGKTTTANLIFHILKAAKIQAGMITTVNALIGDKVLDTGFHVTTPEAPIVQGYLAEMVASGMTHVVLETTSHGLEQKRVAACEFDVGVVTNITHEHLDYHGSYEEYLGAKGSLLSELSKTVQKKSSIQPLAVLNKDDSSYGYLEGLVADLRPGVSSVSYGLGIGAQVIASGVNASPAGLTFSVQLGAQHPMEIHSSLVGDYNVSNCLAAISATAAGLGIDEQFIRQGIASLPGIPGRMEVIDLGQDFLAIVDFAHTPNALENALSSARHLTGGKVIAVFGSAGLRDQAKRGMMAEISGRLADLSVLTAEDPRSESLDKILSEIAAGIVSQGGVEGRSFWRVPDRGEAIRFALSLAQTGDLVISCGKGHEQSMCFGEIEYAWDDRTAMRAALAELQDVDGPPMPYLPTQDN
jgi:UDP-N-acetylmuramoyl-L-alanyl-D-glutamate--2,6-diaminopimelate ligase